MGPCLQRGLAALAAAALAACGTVDVGPPTGPPMGCNGSSAFFVTDVWPKYLDHWSCGKSDCHDSQSGHGTFRLVNPPCPSACPPATTCTCPPDPATPLAAWPNNWRLNYTNAARFLNCGDPTASQLLAIPGGKGQPHPGGVIFSGQDAADAEQLFVTWATPK